MKKVLAMLVAMGTMFTMLAACGGGSSSSAPASTGSASSAASVSEGTDNGEWPAIGSEGSPVTVKIIIKDVLPTEEDVIAMCAAIEEKMASHGQYVKIEFVEPPAGSYATAVPLAVRTGEIDADIIYFQGGGDLAIAQEGLLEDLTPYIEASTYVKEIMLPVNQARTQNYPYLLWLAPPRISTAVMREDWATQLSSYEKVLADPTVENYKALFLEMKEKGLVKFAWTLDNSNNAGEGNLRRINSVFNQAFGVATTLVKQDGKWVFSRATKAEKDKLAFYAELYKEGLLDPDYLTNTWDVMEQRFFEGDAGIIAGNAGDVIQIYNDKMKAANDAKLVVLPPAKGVAQGYAAVDVTKEDRGLSISVDSKVKDAAFAIFEFMASPEGRIIDKCGIEGVHYNIEGGKIVFTEKRPEWWARFWETTNNFPTEPALAQPLYSEAAQQSLDYANKYFVEDVNVLIPEELAPQWDAMKVLYDEYSADVVRGVKSIDTFDDFVQKWNAAGGDAFAEYFAKELG